MCRETYPTRAGRGVVCRHVSGDVPNPGWPGCRVPSCVGRRTQPGPAGCRVPSCVGRRTQPGPPGCRVPSCVGRRTQPGPPGCRVPPCVGRRTQPRVPRSAAAWCRLRDGGSANQGGIRALPSQPPRLPTERPAHRGGYRGGAPRTHSTPPAAAASATPPPGSGPRRTINETLASAAYRQTTLMRSGSRVKGTPFTMSATDTWVTAATKCDIELSPAGPEPRRPGIPRCAR